MGGDGRRETWTSIYSSANVGISSTDSRNQEGKTHCGSMTEKRSAAELPVPVPHQCYANPVCYANPPLGHLRFSNVPITAQEFPTPPQQCFALSVPCFPVSFFHFWDLLRCFFREHFGNTLRNG